MAPVEVDSGGYKFTVGNGKNWEILGSMDKPIGTVHGHEKGGAVSLNPGVEPDKVSGGVVVEDRGGRLFVKLPPGETMRVGRVTLTGK